MKLGPSMDPEIKTQIGPESRPAVVVVGAGVSGCACAAWLAARGVHVTVLNSALDAVGMPGYGPEVITPEGGWDEIADVLAALPATVRSAWIDSAGVPAGGAPMLVVDRRALSIETKRSLEYQEGLEFRQGLVVDVRADEPESSSRVLVETIFGEVIQADAVVIAVGLGLGGEVNVGVERMPGGRYGEIPADGLRSALQKMGIRFEETVVAVGPRFAGSGGIDDALPGLRSGQAVVEDVVVPLRELTDARSRSIEERIGRGRVVTAGTEGEWPAAGEWPAEYPPAPHWTDGLRSPTILLATEGRGNASTPVAIQASPVATPDGAATGEFHVGPTYADEVVGSSAGDLAESRLAHTVRGLVIVSRDEEYRLTLPPDRSGGGALLPVWVTGRAAGAQDYVSSLRSAIEAGESVLRSLRRDHAAGEREPGR